MSRALATAGAVSVSEVAAELDRLAAQTGDPAYSKAARALLWDVPGRRPVNDDSAIEEAQWLMQSGAAKSLNAALRQVAKTRNSGASIRSVVERLRRKIAARRKIYPT